MGLLLLLLLLPLSGELCACKIYCSTSLPAPEGKRERKNTKPCDCVCIIKFVLHYDRQVSTPLSLSCIYSHSLTHKSKSPSPSFLSFFFTLFIHFFLSHSVLLTQLPLPLFSHAYSLNISAIFLSFPWRSLITVSNHILRYFFFL